MASSFLSKDQCFLQGMTRTQGACMCAAWAKQTRLNFHVDSEGADHTSVSRSDRTLNANNYVLQMHLCLQLFPGSLSGSSARNTPACRGSEPLVSFLSEQDHCWQRGLVFSFLSNPVEEALFRLIIRYLAPANVDTSLCVPEK